MVGECVTRTSIGTVVKELTGETHSLEPQLRPSEGRNGCELPGKERNWKAEEVFSRQGKQS